MGPNWRLKVGLLLLWLLLINLVASDVSTAFHYAVSAICICAPLVMGELTHNWHFCVTGPQLVMVVFLWWVVVSTSLKNEPSIINSSQFHYLSISQASLERIYQEGLWNLQLGSVLFDLAFPVLGILGLVIAAPYVVAHSFIPNLGKSKCPRMNILEWLSWNEYPRMNILEWISY